MERKKLFRVENEKRLCYVCNEVLSDDEVVRGVEKIEELLNRDKISLKLVDWIGDSMEDIYHFDENDNVIVCMECIERLS